MDDLLFSSKIRTTAKLAGAELSFARTPGDILAQARSVTPRLVIFDLNSPKIDAIKTVQALRQDPALAAVPTMGFVSHVDTRTILAAREAGVDEVMARSAFAANLDKILSEAK